MITTADLKAQTKADLAKMAKRLGVSGSAAMRKDELVAAVAKASKTVKPKATNGHTVKAKIATVEKKTNAKSERAKAERVGKPTSSRPDSKPKMPASGSQGRLKNNETAVSAGRSGLVKAAKASSPTRATTASAKRTVGKSEKLPAAVSKTPSTKTPSKAPVKKLVANKKLVPTPTDPKVLKRIRELQLQRQSNKDIAYRPTLVRPPGTSEPIWEKEPVSDRIALFVRDAHWMHASWDITRNAIERAKAAMMEQWHGAKPILRLLRMDDTGTSNTAEMIERDIEIHGGSRNWYIEWSGEAASFRVLIGYLSLNGRFHVMAKSNIVRTPAAGSADAVDEHWSDLGAESERIFAISGGYDTELETGELQEMLEDRLHRSLGAPALAKLGAGADGPFRRRGGFHFDMDVELVVYGSTVPDGYLTLNGEPVTLRTDGTFALRVPFPDRRQVLPAVACSRDGTQQRTIVVAVERNTKIMEPLESEQDTGE